MKILNLYCGIGGNRKLWKNCEITAIENNPDIANCYSKLYPNDNVIIEDAHDYLLKNFENFDFIWSSPPCTSHSQFRQNMCVNRKKSPPMFIDMKLYQEILFLKHNFDGYWVVENVKPYYKTLIDPSFEMERHLFWSNFNVSQYTPPKTEINIIKRGTKEDLQKKHGIDLASFNLTNKRKILRNCVNPLVGKHLLQRVLKLKNPAASYEVS